MRRLFDSCQDLPDGAAGGPSDAMHRRRPRDDPRERLQGLLHPARSSIAATTTLGVNPFPCPVDTAILTWEWGAYLGTGRARRTASTCASAPGRGAAPNTFPTLAKTSANYANSQLIKMEAIAEGYSEGIALDTAGYLSEGSGQNLFIVRDNVIYTPPLTASILPGITRDSVITLAKRSRVPTSAKRCCRARCSTSRRGVLRRHRGRDHADPVGGQDSDRQRPPRPDHRGHPAGVLRRHQRRGRRPARLARATSIPANRCRRRPRAQPAQPGAAARSTRRRTPRNRLSSADAGRTLMYERTNGHQRTPPDRRRQRGVGPAPEGRQLPDDARQRHARRRLRRKAARPGRHRGDGGQASSAPEQRREVPEAPGRRPRLQHSPGSAASAATCSSSAAPSASSCA